MNLRSLAFAALSCLLVFALGCGGDDDDNGNRKPIGASANYLFDPIEVLGTSYELELSLDTDVEIDFFELILGYEQATQLKLDVDFIVDEGGGYLASYVVKEASITPTVKLPDGAPAPPLAFINQAFQAMVGKGFSVPIDDSGQPGEWDGIKEMLEAVAAIALELPDDQRDAAEQFIHPEMARQWELLFSSLYAPTPPNNLYVGDKWSGKREASPGVMAALTYSAASVDGQYARIEYSGTLSAAPEITSEIPGLPIEEAVKYETATGPISGHYTVDTETGLAVRYESAMVLDAVLELLEGDDIGLPQSKLKIVESVSAKMTRK